MSDRQIIKMLVWELEQMHREYASRPKIGMNAMHTRAMKTLEIAEGHLNQKASEATV